MALQFAQFIERMRRRQKFAQLFVCFCPRTDLFGTELQFQQPFGRNWRCRELRREPKRSANDNFVFRASQTTVNKISSRE